MRGVQLVLAGLPGGRVHHDGAGGDGAREGELGAESGGEIIAMNTLIRNGTVVTARETAKADVLLEGAVIKEVRAGIPEAAAAKVIDAAGMYVILGGIDVHTHLDMPFGGTRSADDFESGTMAAAFGGTTSIVDFAIQYRGQTLHHAWETWMKKADGKAAIDYGFHMIMTEMNDQVELEMDALVGQGITSFKLF